jgi:hypothetical protein
MSRPWWPARSCALPRFNPNEETMGSSQPGSTPPTIGAGLPQHLKIDRAGGSRASVGGRV